MLKVAHHGSDTSSSGEFLGEVDPLLAVVSVGRDNPFGHPSPDVLARLVAVVGNDRVYSTSVDGTVELVSDGLRLWVRPET